jgi:hypothetical protein
VRRTGALLYWEQMASLGNWADGIEPDSFDVAEALYDLRVSTESRFVTPKSPDNEEALRVAVNRLISENATEEYFSVGQSFGKTSATMERWEQSLYDGRVDAVLECATYLPGTEYRNGKRLWWHRRVSDTTAVSA